MARISTPVYGEQEVSSSDTVEGEKEGEKETEGEREKETENERKGGTGELTV